MTARKPVAPFYAVAVLWVTYGLLFPLYAVSHYLLLSLVSAAGFWCINQLCLGTKPIGEPTTTVPKTAEKPKDETTGNEELDKMLKDGRLAISEMKRLDDNIADPSVSADIVRLEQVSQKIFDEVKRDPKKLPQIRRFMDYYLPTTLKLLNHYDRVSDAGVSGENIDASKNQVETMLRTIVEAFEKQLDSLYGADALDISTDITVLETMMAREGLTGQQMKADAVQKDNLDIKLEL